MKIHHNNNMLKPLANLALALYTLH